MVAIYLLLFFIGISVGGNEQIMKNLDKIGLNAFLLTLAAVMGSILVSYLFYVKFFKNNKR